MGASDLESFNGSSGQFGVATSPLNTLPGFCYGQQSVQRPAGQESNHAEQNKRPAALGETAVDKYMAKARTDHLRRIHGQFSQLASAALC
jgi:hypothetical protein